MIRSLDGEIESRVKPYAIIVGVLLWLGLIVNVGLTQGGLNKSGVHVGLDFFQFYAGAVALKSGQVENMYNRSYYHSQYERVFGSETLFEINNPCAPFHTLLYVPLTHLSYINAYILWILIGIFLWMTGIFLLQTHSRRKSILWSLSFTPVAVCAMQGQNSFLTFFILSATYMLWSKNKLLFAGLMLSMVIYKPYWAFGVLILWLFNAKKNARALLGFLIGCIVISGISFLMLRGPTYAYFEFLSNHSIATGTASVHWLSKEHTLYHAIHQLIPGLSVSNMRLVQLLLSIFAITMFHTVQKRFSDTPALQYAWSIILTFWLTPHMMHYELLLFIIPAILLWFSMPSDRELLKKSFIFLWITSLVYIPLNLIQLNFMPLSVHIGVVTMVSVTIYLFKSCSRASLNK